MDEEILFNENPMVNATYDYPVIDQSNQEITNPNLNLGYLKKEYISIHHESIPEKWHYRVISFSFSNGEIYKVESEYDPHIQIIDAKKGIFNFVKQEGEENLTVTGQSIAPVTDEPLIPAWDETKIFYRYIPYTEKELSEKQFLIEGPQLLAEAQETINDLLLTLAEMLGGEEK